MIRGQLVHTEHVVTVLHQIKSVIIARERTNFKFQTSQLQDLVAEGLRLRSSLISEIETTQGPQQGRKPRMGIIRVWSSAYLYHQASLSRRCCHEGLNSRELRSLVHTG